MVNKHVGDSVGAPSRQVKEYFDLGLGPGGFQLTGASDMFGPTRDPGALGAIIFALELAVAFHGDNPLVRDFADAVLTWSTLLSRIEQGDVKPLDSGLSFEDIDRWLGAAIPICPSDEVAKKVSHQMHWLLDPVAYQFEQRRKAILAAKDWLQASFDIAQEFLSLADSLEHYSESTSGTASARCLAGYHLLRGAARLHAPPTWEELEKEPSEPEAPEDVRLGYVELGLSKANLQFGERLKAWEFALRYKPELMDYEPNSEAVTLWAKAICDAYITLFEEALDTYVEPSVIDLHRTLQEHLQR